MHAFLRIHDPEVLDDLESAALRLGDVHVHPEVMLAGHHFSWAARPLRDLCVIQCFDDVVLLQRAGLFDGSLPEPQTAVHARSGTASRELGAARIELVVLSEQFPAEGIADVLVVVEAAVQTFHLFGREKAQEVLLEVRADEVSAALRKPGLVKLLDETAQDREERSC